MDADFWFGRLVPRLGLCGWEGLQPGSPCEDLSIRVYKLNKVVTQDSCKRASNYTRASSNPYI